MNLLQQFLTASQDFRDLMLRQDKQDERIKAIENKIEGGGGSDSPIKYDYFKQFCSFGVRLLYDSDANKIIEENVLQRDSIIRLELDNSTTTKYLNIYTGVDMGYYDEIFLRVFASSDDIKDYTISSTDNPFKESTGNTEYLQGDTINGASSIMFTTENIPKNTLLGRIKLPNKTGSIHYNFDLDYTKVTFN